MTDRRVALERALELAAGLAPDGAAEDVPVERAAGRVLAEDVLALTDLPAHDESAMDGFAFRTADRGRRRRMSGDSSAGYPPPALPPSAACRISTGAALPEGADAVVRLEDCELRDEEIELTRRVAPGRDVRRQGEVIRKGHVAVRDGTKLGSGEVLVLASVGRRVVRCRRRPSVAILATGSELAALGADPSPYAVYDSNRAAIGVQAEAAGARVVASRRVGDDPAATREAISELLLGDDAPRLLVTLGGLSVGPHDHVREALAQVEVEELMHGVRATPCRPLWLGRLGDQIVLGLPGNPVSAAVGFHVFGRPLLGVPDPWHRRAPLAAPQPTRDDRAHLVPCRFGGRGLETTPGQGSHSVVSLIGADAVAWVPAADHPLPAGEWVRFSLLP